MKGRLEKEMGLEESCRKYEGKLISIKPVYGWGWSRIEKDAPKLSYEEAAGPSPFHLRIKYFYEYLEELRGAVGVIEEVNHPQNGFWAVFYTRHIGNYNFTDKLEMYNILLAPDEPKAGDTLEDPNWAASWPIWHFSLSPQFWGYAFISETTQMYLDFSHKQHLEYLHRKKDSLK